MRFALVVFCLSLPAFGCGGSSSETPPPLQPDPTSARYTGPRFPSAADDVTTSAPATPDEDDVAEQPRRAAAATWGSGKTAPAPAPKMTSPTALPATSASAAPATSAAPHGAPATNF